ncbi:hypothetical protein C121_67 [Stenotrophomonas phage C121]|uniref:exonuclease n=1 Tax=Stenotrophomonas phage C121 TaxID=2914029 RepID=UPI0023290749|nr:exonuclease [Stenotrophomonas phage C121]UKL14800.1 hypothetical protein C121_67 [Stenotrophomonas phage C121]
MKITNRKKISLTLAVWAVNDEYDYQSIPNYISVTTLMKPLKQIILAKRLPEEERMQLDVEDLIASSYGTSIHSAVEHSWSKYKVNLKKLGYSDDVISRIKLNPKPEEITPDDIVIYQEQRGIAKIGKWNLGGKFDFVAEGRVEDVKSTSAYAWTMGSKDSDYQLQGSLYRLIHPDKITDGHIRINFLFTDWRKSDARSNPQYPQSRLAHRDIPLLSIAATHDWAVNKLNQLERYMDSPEEDIPDCTDEELWIQPSKFKYYTDPSKTNGRAYRSFDTKKEADDFMITRGKGGIVVEVKGGVRRCSYCPVFNICKQQLRYNHD